MKRILSFSSTSSSVKSKEDKSLNFHKDGIRKPDQRINIEQEKVLKHLGEACDILIFNIVCFLAAFFRYREHGEDITSL